MKPTISIQTPCPCGSKMFKASVSIPAYVYFGDDEQTLEVPCEYPGETRYSAFTCLECGEDADSPTATAAHLAAFDAARAQMEDLLQDACVQADIPGGWGVVHDLHKRAMDV